MLQKLTFSSSSIIESSPLTYSLHFYNVWAMGSTYDVLLAKIDPVALFLITDKPEILSSTSSPFKVFFFLIVTCGLGNTILVWFKVATD